MNKNHHQSSPLERSKPRNFCASRTIEGIPFILTMSYAFLLVGPFELDVIKLLKLDNKFDRQHLWMRSRLIAGTFDSRTDMGIFRVSSHNVRVLARFTSGVSLRQVRGYRPQPTRPLYYSEEELTLRRCEEIF
jgi:hypothetical protein